MLKGLMAASVLLAGLSACSNGPEPIIEPSPSQTPTADPPDSPTVTPEPEPESAKAFIRRWERVSTEMQVTGDTSEYLAMTDDCSSCQALADQVSQIYETGGSVVARDSVVISIVKRGEVDGVIILDYTIEAPASKVLDENGDVESKFAGGVSTYQINVMRTAGAWSVQRISRIES